MQKKATEQAKTAEQKKAEIELITNKVKEEASKAAENAKKSAEEAANAKKEEVA